MTKRRPILQALAILAGFVVLALILAAIVKVAAAKTPVQPDPPLPRIAAHKGTTVAKDENTISAFRYALPYADAIDTDIRLTSDKKMVIMHDSTLDRTTNCTGRVSARTLAYIKACTTPRGQHPPSLRQLLQWAAGQDKEVELYLQLKGPWSQTQVSRFVNEATNYPQIRFITASSTSEAVLARVAVANDALSDEKAGRHLELGLVDGGTPRYADPFRVCDHYGAYFAEYPYFTKKYVTQLQQVCNPPTTVAAGRNLDTIADYEDAADTGAWVIIVEDPKDARRWLESR